MTGNPTKAGGGFWDNNENDNVATSPDLWRPLADAIGGFDLDPASGAEPEPIATERFTSEDDGLAREWVGNVFLNPPFSEKKDWYRKLVEQVSAGNVDRAVAIAKVDTSTEWFQRWFSTADVICYLDHRDCYVAAGDSPTFATMVGAWNPTDELLETMDRLGTVTRPVATSEQSTLGGTA